MGYTFDGDRHPAIVASKAQGLHRFSGIPSSGGPDLLAGHVSPELHDDGSHHGLSSGHWWTGLIFRPLTKASANPTTYAITGVELCV